MTFYPPTAIIKVATSILFTEDKYMLKAGFSRVDVTPPLGSYISGYFHKRYAKGILDPLYLNAVALSDENETVVIIAADIIGILAKFSDDIRKLISERTGVPEDHIMISCLHQHTSISLNDDSDSTYSDKTYTDVLYRKFADVAQMAIADMKTATLWIGERETEKPISFIRRYKMKNGSIVTNPSSRRIEEILHPCGEADNTVRLLRFKREEGNDIAFVNFSTHPDVIGGELFSADWPGFVRRFVESDIEGVSCLLLNGVQGDSNHFNILGGMATKGYEHSEYMGRMIADAVVNIWDKAVLNEDIAIHAGITNVYNRTRTDGEERYEECKQILEDNWKSRENAKKYSATILGEATRIVNIRSATIYSRLPVTAISLGYVGIVGFGGEAFTHYATAVREACPERYIIAACCSNGGEGYLPTTSAFSEGGYEANSSSFSSTLEEECVGAAVDMLKKM